jgi:hypothetical protein
LESIVHGLIANPNYENYFYFNDDVVFKKNKINELFDGYSKAAFSVFPVAGKWEDDYSKRMWGYDFNNVFQFSNLKLFKNKIKNILKRNCKHWIWGNSDVAIVNKKDRDDFIDLGSTFIENSLNSEVVIPSIIRCAFKQGHHGIDVWEKIVREGDIDNYLGCTKNICRRDHTFFDDDNKHCIQ